MNQRLLIACGCLALMSCATSDRSGEGASDKPEMPSLTVRIEGASEITTEWASVAVVPAPAVELLALIRPDRNHSAVVPAPVSGVLLRIRPQQHAHRGDTLAVLGVGSGVAGKEMAVRGVEDGSWLPLRRRTQFVLQEDTLGVIEEHGSWLALGTLSDVDAAVFHQGDAVVLRFGDDRHAGSRGARVEWVRRAATSPYSADVAVEFRAPEGAFDSQPGPIRMIATPGPHDSVAAVPASAVVHLPPGAAVFVPVGLGRYDVRWLSTGPSVGDWIVVREGVAKGTSIVTHGLATLVAAARDSIERRSHRP
jgi:hypothetical protein